MPTSVFISYRSRDATIVRGLQIELGRRLPTTTFVRDIESFRQADDLRTVIPAQLQRADVVLVVIGPSWTPEDGQSLLLERADDWVRFEVSLALSWRKRLVPVLADGATMPHMRQLPRDVRALADIVATPLRDSDWESDMARLVAVIDPSARPTSSHPPTVVSDSGPVAGGDITITGHNVAGRDLGRGGDR